MKNSRIALCAALGIVLLGSSTVAFGEDASSKMAERVDGAVHLLH